MPHRIEQRFKAVDAKDMEGFLALLTDNHSLVFGGRDPVIGKADARAQVSQFWSSIASLRHNIKHIHDTGDTIIVESLVDYERLDGKVVHVPCCDVFRMRGNKIAQTCAYLDQSPVWA